jgi:hypothetical protein
VENNAVAPASNASRMPLLEWGALVEERILLRAPKLAHALRGKDGSGRLQPGAGRIVFQRPLWRSAHGFASVWPSLWPRTENDEYARATFFRPLPYFGAGGDPETELRYFLDGAGAEEAARDIAAFLAPDGDDAWTHPANLREPRADADSFLIDLVHEFGHAVGSAVNGATVEMIVIGGIEAAGGSVKALGGHVVRQLRLGARKWDDAVGTVAGVVAERLFADRDATFDDAIALFLADRSYFSDLEEAIGEILASRGASAMDLQKLNEALSEAVEEARASLHPHMDRIVREAEKRRAMVVAEAMPILEIPWNAELSVALCGRRLD